MSRPDFYAIAKRNELATSVLILSLASAIIGGTVFALYAIAPTVFAPFSVACFYFFKVGAVLAVICVSYIVWQEWMSKDWNVIPSAIKYGLVFLDLTLIIYLILFG